MAKGTKGTKAKKTEKLSKAEQVKLEQLEVIVRANISAYIEVGNALKTIKDEKLYKANHKSFNLYCIKVWGFTRSTAHDYLKAVAVAASVRTSVQIDLSKAVVLFMLKGDDAAEKRQAIVDMNGFNDMTVREVLAEVKKLQPPSEPKPERKGKVIPFETVKTFADRITKDGVQEVETVIAELQKVIAALRSAASEKPVKSKTGTNG
jgi:hypothetical protein